MTLRLNNIHGTFAFAEAERLCQMLLGLEGRAIPPEQWVTGLIVQGHQSAQGAVLEGLI